MPSKFSPTNLIIAIVLISLPILFFISRATSPKPPKNLTAFAQCLTQKGIVIYGAYWCPHCQREKARFGNAWKEINYVECTEKPELCNEKGIATYPTWILPDGTKLTGEQTIDWAKFSTRTSCPL